MKKILLTAFIAFGFCGIAFSQQGATKGKHKQKNEKKVKKNPEFVTDEKIYKEEQKSSLARPRAAAKKPQ